MEAHVSSVDFLPGTTVGLYLPQTRPTEQDVPIAVEQVPESGQVVFERAEPYDRFWIAGRDMDGRWKTVQCHSKPGEPVDVRARLELTRPDEDVRERVVGARGTMHVRRLRGS